MLKVSWLCLAASLLWACAPTPVAPGNTAAAGLRFVADTVRSTHPALQGGASRQAFDHLAQALESKTSSQTTQAEGYALAARLLASLRDGHTLVFPPTTAERLPVRFRWLQDGLVVSDSVALEVNAGDEVVRLGSLTPAHLLERLRSLIPAENDDHIRALGAYLLPLPGVLEALGIHPHVPVSLEFRKPNGDAFKTSLTTSNTYPSSTPRPAFGWRLEPTFGLFWLDACDDTPEYRQAVHAFFTAVKQAQQKRVAIDLRENGGGDSQVLNALLEHLPASTVKVFHKPERNDSITVAHEHPDTIFDGEVLVLTGPFTFSTANWIAGTIQDNRLGRIIGEATGNAPTSFGNVKAFTTPAFKLRFQVSQTLWLRPDASLDPASCLTPDVLIPTTVRDVQQGRDPVLEWLAQPQVVRSTRR